MLISKRLCADGKSTYNAERGIEAHATHHGKIVDETPLKARSVWLSEYSERDGPYFSYDIHFTLRDALRAHGRTIHSVRQIVMGEPIGDAQEEAKKELALEKREGERYWLSHDLERVRERAAKAGLKITIVQEEEK